MQSSVEAVQVAAVTDRRILIEQILDAGLESPKQIVGKTDHELGWRDQAELYRADDRLVMDSGYWAIED